MRESAGGRRWRGNPVRAAHPALPVIALKRLYGRELLWWIFLEEPCKEQQAGGFHDACQMPGQLVENGGGEIREHQIGRVRRDGIRRAAKNVYTRVLLRQAHGFLINVTTEDAPRAE